MNDVVSDGTAWGSDEWYEARWNSIPAETQAKIVEHLKKIPNSDEVASAMGDPWFHFSTGMGIRNYLRQVVQDEDLPDAPYPDGEFYKNWDDYYKQAIRAAVNE